MKENKGFSLVELLIAIAIASIVAGGIGYLLVTSLRMYNNETTEVVLQQELQVTLNQIMDYAMETQTLVVDNDDANEETRYVAFGTASSNDLAAQIFWMDGNRLYMKGVTIPDYKDTSSSNLKDKVENEKNSGAANATQYLLAENIEKFYAQLDETAYDTTEHTYTNPLSMNISLEFQKTAAKSITKKVSDRAVFRNKIKETLYINGDAYKATTKTSSNSGADLEVTTETVEMEEKLGVIKHKSETNTIKDDMHILEIVPDYSYDYMQFAIGGEHGNLLNTNNIDYGSKGVDDGRSPIKSNEFEGYIIRAAGMEQDSDNQASQISSFYPNIGADLNAVEVTYSSENVGWYEYVGEEKGVYGISDINTSLSKTSSPGMGDTKPIILSFTTYKDNWRLDRFSSKKYYTPIFEYCSQDDGSKAFYYPEEYEGNNNKKRYKRIYKEVPNDYGEGSHSEFVCYEYAGVNKGDTDVIFKRYNPEESEYKVGNNMVYKVRDDIYDYFEGDDGEYYAFYALENEWEMRDPSSAGKENGFDFNQKITNVTMFSRYNPAASKIGMYTDFGWIWHLEEKDTQTYNDIVNGNISTSYSVLKDKLYNLGENTDINNRRIYLKDHKRCNIVNNELFKLFVMQDSLEQYVDGTRKMLDISHGIWDGDKYNSVNYAALKAWEADDHKVTLSVRTPGEITGDLVDACDLIVVAGVGDGGFLSAQIWINGIRGTNYARTEYTKADDISFDVAVKIYKKAIDERVALACPYSMRTAGGGNAGDLNLSRLYEMLYGCVNGDISKSEIINSTYLSAKNRKIEEQGEADNYWTQDSDYQSALESVIFDIGSGRDIFSDFIKSLSGQNLSNSLDAGMKSATGMVYIKEDNSAGDAGRIVDESKPMPDPNTDATWGFAAAEPATNSAFAFKLLVNDALKDQYLKGIVKNDHYGCYIDSSNPANASHNVHDDHNGHSYKFYYKQPEAGKESGIMRNLLLYNDNSPLLTFNKTGSTGLMMIQVVNLNASKKETAPEVGIVEVIGADDMANYERRIAAMSAKSTEIQTVLAGSAQYKNEKDMKVYTVDMKYTDNPIEYTINPVKLKDDAISTSKYDQNNKKVLYLTEAEYEKAKVEGLWVYCRIKSSVPIDRFNPCYLKYTRNERYGQAEDIDGDGNCRDGWNNYDIGSMFIYNNDPSKAYEEYVTELEFCIDPFYFQNFKPSFNYIEYNGSKVNNNLITALIEPYGDRKYFGSDELYLYVRDDFDLD